MRFDKLVDELLEQNTVEENWKRKLAIGAAALGLAGGHVKADTPQSETQRRVAAAEALAKGEKPAPRYKDSDQSPEAKKYREHTKKIEAAKRLANP
jgi:hypothetical protein